MCGGGLLQDGDEAALGAGRHLHLNGGLSYRTTGDRSFSELTCPEMMA